MSPTKAQNVITTICINLKDAINELMNDEMLSKDENIIIISRSDSTLRGHYPIETNVINDILGPFDAHFIIPAFIEGGRITKDSTHYIATKNRDNQEVLQPVHLTEFAKDSVFGYTYSYLPKYVQEKTNGSIHEKDVERFLLNDIRNTNNNNDLLSRLTSLKENKCCVVDVETYENDLNIFCNKIKEAVINNNKKFLFRSGASLVSSLAQLPLQPMEANKMKCYVRNNKPGIILIGSHVSKTTEQLYAMLDVYKNNSIIESIEVNVDLILNEKGTIHNNYLQSIINQINTIHTEKQKSIILYTTRNEKQFKTHALRLQFGEKVSLFLMNIVSNLPSTIGFLISKGGITSHDIISVGLELSTIRLLGQIMDGCSVVCCPDNHDKFPNLPVVIFPGNVGDKFGLVIVFQRFIGEETCGE